MSEAATRARGGIPAKMLRRRQPAGRPLLPVRLGSAYPGRRGETPMPQPAGEAIQDEILTRLGSLRNPDASGSLRAFGQSGDLTIKFC